jgi:hypothetical protein
MNTNKYLTIPFVIILGSFFMVTIVKEIIYGDVPVKISATVNMLESQDNKLSKSSCVKSVKSDQTVEQDISSEKILDELLDRFVTTKSVGVFTKLSIKGNVDRLNKSFAIYHDGNRPPNINELRQRYDLMVQEMIMIVQKKDPDLAKDFYDARLLLWSYLAEPEKYASYMRN